MSSPLTLAPGVDEAAPDAGAILHLIEGSVVARRAEAEKFQLAFAWADAHRAIPVGNDRFVLNTVAADGVAHEVDSRDTTLLGASRYRVYRYAIDELAISLRVSSHTASRYLSNAIDCAHRLPAVYDAVAAGRLEVWVARKIVTMTADLNAAGAAEVNAAIASHLGVLPTGRLLEKAEAAVATADPEGQAAKHDEERNRRLMHLSRVRDGHRTLFIRTDAVSAARFYETATVMADNLADADTTHASAEELRAAAVGLLADPQAALDFLNGKDPRRGKAIVYVHTTAEQLSEVTGVNIARVEDIGPACADLVREFIGHDHITVKPVIDFERRAPGSGCLRDPCRPRRADPPGQPRRGLSLQQNRQPSRRPRPHCRLYGRREGADPAGQPRPTHPPASPRENTRPWLARRTPRRPHLPLDHPPRTTRHRRPTRDSSPHRACLDMDGKASILHADLDSFYASVEQRDNPALRGRPVLVGGGVVLAASYEAKRSGVHTPMPLREAKRLCPDAVVVPPRMGAYAEASRAVFEVFRDTTPLVDALSIDEAFLEVGGLERLVGSPEFIGHQLRSRIREEVGLPITVGIARTKFLAKVASVSAKPDGLLLVSPEGELDFLHPLPVGRLWGVGAVTAAALQRRGLNTVGDVAKLDESALTSILGKGSGRHLHALAHNRDPRPVETGRRRKSIGAQSALGNRRRSGEEVEARLAGLVERVARRMRAANRRARTMTLRLRLADMSRLTRSHSWNVPTDRTDALVATARQLLRRERELLDARGLTLIGVSVSGFDEHSVQLELPLDRRPEAILDATLDDLRARFGSSSVMRGSLMGRGTGFSVPLLPD